MTSLLRERDQQTGRPVESEASAPGDLPASGFLTRRRAIVTLLVLAIALVFASLAALGLGSESVPLTQIASGIVSKLFGSASKLSPEQDLILFHLRAPRILMAIGVGAALAAAGAAFQSLLRNPLADPYILGVSGGAALGAILAILLIGDSAIARPACGFLGAILATVTVYKIGQRTQTPAHLALAGVVTSTFLASVIVLLMALADSVRLRSITMWLLGDLSSGSPESMIFVLAAAVAGVLLLLPQSRALNLMMVGENDAFALGVETVRVRWIVFLTASLLTGAAVAAGGAIGYVGLVIPHLVRLSTGPDNRLVIPAAALAGALLVLGADTIARTAFAPRELPAGAITALIGAPIFVYLLLRRRK
jgi:iron complex transport system permease protein